MTARPIAALALAMLLVGIAACAPGSGRYTFGSTYAEDIRTVAVPVFENATFTTGLEAMLTEAVIKRLQSSTPWRVTSERAADTVLRGAIVDADLRSLSARRPGGVPEELAQRVTIDFTFRDNRTGELLVARRGFSATSTFVPSRSVRGEPGERLEIGQRQALQELAEAIVGELRAAW